MPIAKIIITGVLVKKSDTNGKNIQWQHKYKARVSAKILVKMVTQNS